jgi:predicted enzyme related to lactoylglutathione lyase
MSTLSDRLLLTRATEAAHQQRRTDMLRGLTTVSFFADDVAAAGEWYARLLGVQPYFARPVEGPPVYLEFRLGDYQHELGLVDRRFAPSGSSAAGSSATEGAGPTAAIVYWHVDDVQAAMDRLLSLGAAPLQPITERGPGFVTAAVTDPFGNILGIMYNQHYLDVLIEASRNQTVLPPT